jgi:hypothetical protein
MTAQVLGQELSSAQALIYSRTNLRRAFENFDDTSIAGIYKNPEDLVIVRTDGTHQVYPLEPVRLSFKSYTARLKDFFSYLGPNYRGPSVWRNNAYVMLKGWHYSSEHGSKLPNAQLQTRWINKFTQVQDEASLVALLQGDQTDLGHLVAPDGLRSGPKAIDFLREDTEQANETPAEHPPYCSCGSFQRQLKELDAIQEEIPGYQPSCIHLAWFNRYREFLVKRAQLRDTCRGQVAQSATAWAYAPPRLGETNGRFVILYTKHGSMAPASHWRLYKPNEIFTQNDAWNLFDAMMDSGFVPFPAMALPQLSHVFKTVNKVPTND